MLTVRTPSSRPAPPARHLRLVGEEAGRAVGGEANGGPAGSEDQTAAFERVRQLALSQLAGRARSRAELANLLQRRGHTAPLVDAVLERLAGVGLIDDTAFADDWLSRRSGTASTRALAVKLRRKGIASEVVERSSAAHHEPAAERDAALALARQRVRATRGLAPEVRRRRLIAFLQRRGFDSAVTRSVIAELDECPMSSEADDT